MLVKCQNCGKEFNKKPKEIKKTKNNFCSRSCAAKYNNIHGNRKKNRSKFEKWLTVRLEETFPDLEFVYNDRNRSKIGLELDIFVPKLNLAFELNGPAHFKPLWGQKALEEIQERDGIKKKLCEDAGIKLVVVDISDMTRFKHPSLEKHVNFVLEEVKSQIQVKTLHG